MITGNTRMRIITGFLSMTILISAGTASDHREIRRLVESNEVLSLEQVLKNPDINAHGTILEVEFEREHGSYIYEIEILDEYGVVREMEVDAKSGKLLKIERED